MGAFGDALLSKVSEDDIEILVEAARKVHPEAGTTIANKREAEPVLLNLRETVPIPKHTFTNMTISCTVSQEHKVTYYCLVKLLILLFSLWNKRNGSMKRGRSLIIDMSNAP